MHRGHADENLNQLVLFLSICETVTTSTPLVSGFNTLGRGAYRDEWPCIQRPWQGARINSTMLLRKGSTPPDEFEDPPLGPPVVVKALRSGRSGREQQGANGQVRYTDSR